MKYAIKWTTKSNAKNFKLCSNSYFIECNLLAEEQDGIAFVRDINLAFRACNIFETYYGDSCLWEVEELQ